MRFRYSNEFDVFVNDFFKSVVWSPCELGGVSFALQFFRFYFFRQTILEEDIVVFGKPNCPELMNSRPKQIYSTAVFIRFI